MVKEKPTDHLQMKKFAVPLELKKISEIESEMELKKLEKEYETELKMLESEKEIERKKLKIYFPPSHLFYLEIARHARLIPYFNEKEVDKYFLHFENVAETLKRHKES